MAVCQFKSRLDLSTPVIRVVFFSRDYATYTIPYTRLYCFLVSSSPHFSLSLPPPQIIKHLRTAEFKPFIVFVKPPSIEKLRETRQNGKVVAGKDDSQSGKPFTVRECLLSVFFKQNDEPDGPDGVAFI